MQGIALDHMHLAQLEQVQRTVNQSVEFKTDSAKHNLDEYWKPGDDSGDCEDIALAKRNRLMAMGWPASDLRMAIALDEAGRRHAVLTVDATDAAGKLGTYVLDNRFAHVEPWQVLTQHGYKWIARYKPGQKDWTRIE